MSLYNIHSDYANITTTLFNTLTEEEKQLILDNSTQVNTNYRVAKLSIDQLNGKFTNFYHSDYCLMNVDPSANYTNYIDTSLPINDESNEIYIGNKFSLEYILQVNDARIYFTGMSFAQWNQRILDTYFIWDHIGLMTYETFKELKYGSGGVFSIFSHSFSLRDYIRDGDFINPHTCTCLIKGDNSNTQYLITEPGYATLSYFTQVSDILDYPEIMNDSNLYISRFAIYAGILTHDYSTMAQVHSKYISYFPRFIARLITEPQYRQNLMNIMSGNIRIMKDPNTKTYTNSTWSTQKTWYIVTKFSTGAGSNVVNYDTIYVTKSLLYKNLLYASLYLLYYYLLKS